MANKRKIRNRLFLAGLACVLVVGGVFAFRKLTQKPTDPRSQVEIKLSEQGYPEEVIRTILPLSSDKINYLLAQDYDVQRTNLILDPYATLANLDRYMAYTQAHPEDSVDTVVLMVNINRDYPFYTHTSEVSDPDNLLVIVNKYYGLPKTYEPDDLVDIEAAYNGRTDGMKVTVRKAAADAFYAMNDALKQQTGMVVKTTTAFRDYAFQNNLYTFYTAAYGQEKADLESARPGFSEHQTGLAMDINANGDIIDDFMYSQQYQWVKDHAHEFGFIIRYQESLTEITGYKKEEWHLRYVGIEHATAIFNQSISLEEYVMRLNSGVSQ